MQDRVAALENIA